MSRRIFIDQFERNLEALDTETYGSALPDVTHTFADAAGTTQLTITNMRIQEPYPLPIFDMTYAHAELDQPLPAPRSFTEFGAPGFVFGSDYDDPGFSTFYGDGISLILVDYARLTWRGALFKVGHELGHARQSSLMNALVLAAAGLEPTHPDSDRLLADAQTFTPAYSRLMGYAHRNRAFRDTILRAVEMTGLPTSAGPAFAKKPEDDESLIALSHPEAGIALSALAEALAWRHACDLAETGTLHPGMSRQTMDRLARAAVGSYDHYSGTSLHLDTLNTILRRRQPQSSGD